MTRPRMLLGGAALALLLAVYGGIQWYRNATAPSPVVITRQPPPDPVPLNPVAVITSSKPPVARSTSPAVAEAAAGVPAEAAAIMVHVVGAVKTPGVYRLPPKARLMDAVHAAGGAKTGADLEAVNLASFVQDGEQIRVPALAERHLPRAAEAAGVSAPRSPRVEAPARPVRSTARYPLAASPPADTAVSSGADHGTAAKKMTGVVNLNAASAEDLGTLPGVGPKTAEAILAYRHEHGPFQRVEDLLEIRGIGEKKLGRMRDWVVVK